MRSEPWASAIYFILLTIAFTVTGQLLVKLGMLKVGPSPADASDLPMFVFRAFTNPWVISGLLCAVVAAVCWAVAVSRSDLSFAYPFMAVAIVLVLVLSRLMLGETEALGRWIGVAIVCIGVYVVARSG